MHIKTLLNHVCKYQSFVYRDFKLITTGGDTIEVTIEPRRNSQAICSQCGRPGPVHDRLPPRRCHFVPLWQIAVVFIYSMRRVRCRTCQAVFVERVPWVDGKCHVTKPYALFLSTWARRMSWKEVARTFRTSWDTVYAAVAWVVAYGLEHRDLSGISAIGVDEIQYRKGHKYLTLVYQIDAGCRRLLWVGKDRTTQTIEGFFSWFGQPRSRDLRFICSDMWKPYLNVFATCAAQALNILDRFHIVANLNRALDEVRRDEVIRLRGYGKDAVLTKTKWIWLKKVRNLTRKQRLRVKDLVSMNLRTVRAYLLKEEFQHLWTFNLPSRAAKFLDCWCTDVMRTRIEPMKKIARQLRSHRTLILNYFHARKAFSSGVVEGLNNKAKLTIRKSYGFKGDKTLEIALFHNLGALPEPDLGYKFAG